MLGWESWWRVRLSKVHTCTQGQSESFPSLLSFHVVGGEEGVLLFCEESPILALALDPLDSQQSLWVATTNTHINKWVRHGTGYTCISDMHLYFSCQYSDSLRHCMNS